jgi:serine/threonine protein kinase
LEQLARLSFVRCAAIAWATHCRATIDAAYFRSKNERSVVATRKAECPNCGEVGDVGQPCAERVCVRRGYHFVPAAYAAPDGREADPLAGRTIGDYLIVAVLGVGGFGKVYLALQLPILMPAALKLMHVDLSDPHMHQTKLTKFTGEAAALARLSHPNIVRLLKYGIHDDAPYIVMEFVEGARTLKGHLAEFVGEGREMVPSEMRDILRQTLDGLASAHARHIVHRDIKPENIMLQRVAGNVNFVRILDFGLAKFVDERSETSMAMGTPIYMAPEQMIRKNIGPWTDLYTLGVMAFEMMTGRRPYDGKTTEELIRQKLDGAYDPLSTVADLSIPAPMAAFFRGALAREPLERFRDAEQFRTAMNAGFDALEVGRSIDISALMNRSEVLRIRAKDAHRKVEGERLAQAQQALVDDDVTLASFALPSEALPAAPPVPSVVAAAQVAAPVPSPAVDTGAIGASSDTGSGRAKWPWIAAAAAAVVIGGVALAVSSGGSESTPEGPAVVLVDAERSPTAALAVPAPTPELRETAVAAEPDTASASDTAPEPAEVTVEAPAAVVAATPAPAPINPANALPRRATVQPRVAKPTPAAAKRKPVAVKPARDKALASSAPAKKSAKEYYRDGRRLLGKGDKAGATTAFQAAASRGYSKAHKLLGNIYVQAGNMSKARKAYTAYLRLRPGASDAEVVKDTLIRIGGSAPASGKPAATPLEKISAPKAPTKALPARPSSSAVKGSVARGKARLAACRQGTAKLTMKVRFVVTGATGRVKTATITTAGGAPSSVQSCVVRAFKRMQFPQFSDAEMTVNYPVVL